MNTKNALREHYKARRKALDLRERHTLLAGMYEHFAAVPIARCNIAMSYRAIEANNEVPAEIFESWLHDQFEDIHFCYPKVTFGTREMEAYMDDESLEWENAAFNLVQPCSGNIVLPVEIDVVLVPLLAFDETGNRLGYGKGYYDNYLAGCRPDAVKVGLSWFDPEKRLPEINPYDLPLNYCVTPHQLYVF